MKEDELEEVSHTTRTSPIPASGGNDVLLAQYLLGNDIPEHEIELFMPLYMGFNKDYALANIERYDIPYFQLQLEFCVLCMECGMYEYARETIALTQQELKLTRSIHGMQLQLGVSGVTRTETIQKMEQAEKRRGLLHRIGKNFGSPPPKEGDVQ